MPYKNVHTPIVGVRTDEIFFQTGNTFSPVCKYGLDQKWLDKFGNMYAHLDQGSFVEAFTELTIWMGIRKIIEQVNANETAA